jgi:hypothetical protein
MAPPLAAEGAAEVQAAYTNAASMRTNCIMYETRRSKRQRHSPHRFHYLDPRYNANTGNTGTGNHNSTSKSNKDSNNNMTSNKSKRNSQKRSAAMAKKSVGHDSSEDRPIDGHAKKKEAMEQHTRRCLKPKPQTAIKHSSPDRNCRHWHPDQQMASSSPSSSSSLSSVSLASAGIGDGDGEGEGAPRCKKDEDEDDATDSDSDIDADADDDDWEENRETDNVQSKFEVVGETDVAITVKKGSTAKEKRDRQFTLDCHWNQMLSQLLEYHTEMGTWVIPKHSPSHKSLYNWVAEQRKASRRGYLQTRTPARLEALTKAGVPIDKTHYWCYKHGHHPNVERKWNRKYEELKNYYAKYQTKAIPLQSQPDLYHWNHRQIKVFRRGKMEPHRLEKLREIGCPLDKKYFVATTTVHSDDKRAIGNGTKNNHNHVLPTKTRKLERLRHNRVYEQRFQTAVDQLVKWHDTHGTWFVKEAQNKSLYRYVLKFTTTKDRRAKAWRSPARIAKLRAVGFPIDDYLSSASEDDGNVSDAQSRKRKDGSEHEDDAAIRRSPRRRMPRRRQFEA